MFDSTNTSTACRPADSVTPQNFTTLPVAATEPVPSLDEAAMEIKQMARAVDDRILYMAIKAANLKQRIIAGDAGPNVKWMSWMRRKVKMSQPHLYALINIGEAEDPRAAMEEWRRLNREKSKESRAKKALTMLSENHKLMIALIPMLSDLEAKIEYSKLHKIYGSRL